MHRCACTVLSVSRNPHIVDPVTHDKLGSEKHVTGFYVTGLQMTHRCELSGTSVQRAGAPQGSLRQPGVWHVYF